MGLRASTSIAVIVALCTVRPATAAVVVFLDNQAGFNTAAASFTLAGTEDFEGSNLPPNMITLFIDPLSPGVANGPFPTGTLPAAGVRVQANTLGGNPTTTSPRGTASALATASAGFLGTPTDQVSNNNQVDSFDLLFAPANGQFVRAIGMAPLFFDAASTSPTSHPGTIEIRVYAADQTTLLTTQTMTNVDFTGTRFFGVVTNGGDTIGRINIWGLTGAAHFQGADNISVRTSVVVPVELLDFQVE